MAEDNGAKTEGQAATGANAGADAAPAAPAAPAAGDKLFTQEDVNRLMGEARSRIKQEAIDAAAEKKAEELAAEALSKVAEISTKLEAAEYEATLATLAGQGIDADLLRDTGLKGDALTAYVEKHKERLTVSAAGGSGTGARPGAAAPGSAASEAAIAGILNRHLAGGPVDQKAAETESWYSDILTKIRKEVGS